MRRLRNDLPYTFRPPRPKDWFRPLALVANRHWLLERKYRIEAIQEEGFERVRELDATGDSMLLAPNHADHADPHLMMEIGRRYELPLHFMAAREVFEVSDRASWALQSMGVFSVDRDGPDVSAIKTALSILEQGKPLVLYPEGEIYHHHERLDPLHEGVASIGIKAAARLKQGRQVWLVPVAMRFLHDPGVEATFRDRLTRLEDRIGWTPKPKMDLDERILRLGQGVLGLKESEFLITVAPGGIQERLESLCGQLLEAVETRMGADANGGTAPERVRAMRYRIRRRLLDVEDPPDDEERSILLDDLDRVFTALQAHSYMGDYLLAEPTLDRRAETIMKLEEDLLGFPFYPTPRKARVLADEPISITELLEKGVIPRKGGATHLTRILETQLTELIKRPC